MPNYKFFLFDVNSNGENEFGIYFACFSFVQEKNSFYEKKSTSIENNSHLP